jgi:hypothetical protein
MATQTQVLTTFSDAGLQYKVSFGSCVGLLLGILLVCVMNVILLLVLFFDCRVVTLSNEKARRAVKSFFQHTIDTSLRRVALVGGLFVFFAFVDASIRFERSLAVMELCHVIRVVLKRHLSLQLLVVLELFLRKIFVLSCFWFVVTKLCR